MRGKWTLLALLSLSACSDDHRTVVRVCRDGTLIVRDGGALAVVRPNRWRGWETEPGLTADQLCLAHTEPSQGDR